jgi:hypothetical protein
MDAVVVSEQDTHPTAMQGSRPDINEAGLDPSCAAMGQPPASHPQQSTVKSL